MEFSSLHRYSVYVFDDNYVYHINSLHLIKVLLMENTLLSKLQVMLGLVTLIIKELIPLCFLLFAMLNIGKDGYIIY